VPFTLAAVDKPILGADFFAAHRLLVDSYARCVRDATTLLPLVEPVSQPPRSPLVSALSNLSHPVRELLSEFPSVIGDGSATPRPLHGVEHTIETKGRPVFAKSRCLDPEKLRSAESEFCSLEAMGIVRRSDSPWASPLHIVAKTNGSWRPCGDYRRLNTVTVDDRYPLPSLGLYDKASRLSLFFLYRLSKRVPPGANGGKRHTRNGHYYTFWPFQICFHAFWFENQSKLCIA
jgi:hypothetical protein